MAYAPPMRRGPKDVAVVLLPALLFLALHLPALDYGLVWTDEPEIAEGTILRPPGRILHAFAEPLQSVADFAASPFSQPYYRPLQVVTASLLAERFGRAPRAFRSVTLGLGAITACLFTALAAALLRRRAAALFAGALWAAHPVGLEIYVWVGGLAAALAGVFLLASLLCGVAAIASRGRARRGILVGLSLAALALGLLSKENAAVVPGLQLAIALGLLARARHEGTPWKGRVATAAVLIGAQAALVAGYLFALRPAVLGTSLTGATPVSGRLATQWATSLAAWPELLAWLFLPLHATTSDAVRVVESLLDPAAALGALLAIGSALLAAEWLRRGHGVAALALLWVWVAFLPTSGVAPLLHARAERNLFLSSFGAALLLAAVLPWLRSLRIPVWMIAGIAAANVALLSERTLARQPAWRSTITLFEGDVAVDPRHREGRLNLIVAYAQAHRLADAKRHVDVLLTQREPEGWTSYALDASLLEMACRVNAAVGRDADTLREVERLPPKGGVAQMPGFYACYADALERLGRRDASAAIREKLRRLRARAAAP